MILIGFGYWGKILFRIFEKEINIVCDLNENTKYHIKNKLFFNTIENCISNNKLDKIAIIANNASSHFETAKILLENGYDLWVEKPVALTINEINHLIELAEKNSCVVLVDHTYCYDDNVRKIKDIDIGNPIYYRSIRLANGPVRTDITTLYDLAIHDLSIIDFLYPNLQLKYSNTYNVNEDHNILQLDFTNGFRTTIEYNWSFPIKKRLIVAKGSELTTVHDSVGENVLQIFDKNLNKIDNFINNKETLLNVKEHFFECIKTRNLPTTNLYNSKKIMEWIIKG